MSELISDFFVDSLCSNFKKYLRKSYERRQLWALCKRRNLNTRGNNTNNYVEAAMRVLKDTILDRTKAFNVPQLVDFVSTYLEDHYHRRLVDMANGRMRLNSTFGQRCMPSAKDIPKEDIKQVCL